MTLPKWGSPVVQIDVDLDDLAGVVISGPAGGDILVYDGVDSWRNRVMSGDIAITAAGVTAIQAGVITDADISPTAEIQVSKLLDGAARQILQTDAAGTGVEWTSNMDTITIGATTPAPGTFNTLTKTGTTGIDWSNVSDEDYEIFILSGVTGNPRWGWDEAGDRWTSNFGIILTVGSLDLDDQGSILNIGTAGFNITSAGLVAVAGISSNLWSSTQIVHSGSASNTLELITAVTAVAVTALIIRATTSGDMADDFGVTISFRIGDPGAANQAVAQVGGDRDGADNTGRFFVDTFAAGTPNRAFEVDAAGIGYFDAAGAGDALPTLFDDRDDPKELERYTHAFASGVSEEVMLANRERMVELGIWDRKASGSGYMMRFQPMMRLLAGGIYQNRWALDHLREEHETHFSTVEDRLGVVEIAEATLRHENADLRAEVARLRKLVEV